MRRLECAEVWGGIKNQDVDVCSPGLNVSLYSSSCDGGKGGDVYFFSLCSANRVTRIALAVVIGHGEQVSQISQWVYEVMAARLDEPDLPAMMAHLNLHVMRTDFRAMTTAVVLSYYRDLNQLFYCYAGHPPILARSQDGRWQELLISRDEKGANLPLGVIEETGYVMGDEFLNEKDVLMIYSDGVGEAQNRDGVRFGMERLRATLEEIGDVGPSEMKRAVIQRLRDWTGGPLDHDDVTLLALQLDEHGGSHAE